MPVELLREVHEAGKLPVVNFAAGGIATPADAALMMQLGAEGVFVAVSYTHLAHGSSLGSLSPFFPVSSPLERHERIPRTHVEAIVLS